MDNIDRRNKLSESWKWKITFEKSVEDDVANLIFQHDNASEQEDIKVEIKEEDIEIHD